jgi:hypothetical protein
MEICPRYGGVSTKPLDCSKVSVGMIHWPCVRSICDSICDIASERLVDAKARGIAISIVQARCSAGFI